ncbi:MAG: hypothetical protein HXY34_06630 [Candidatus Thorarchaeota archaeon]|nr:hypothetical protein [Candidatus Thorarchaeota archaeon]
MKDELIQSTSIPGTAYVGLFDENKQCVLLVYWGDSWADTQKGYFQTYYYPQGGGSYTQSSGYIYTSFQKTAKLWWDPGMPDVTPQGVIYSTIDGQGGGIPIAAVDNASRVIKYVVILGYRYQSYSLVDMRVHDVNVVADFNRHDQNSPSPTEPVEEDGTCPGTAEPSDGQSVVNNIMGFVQSCLTTTWLPYPWPVLRLVTSLSTYGIQFALSVDVDLLGSISLSTLTLHHPLIDAATDIQLEAAAAKVLGFSAVSFWSAIAAVSLTAAQMVATFSLLPHARALFMVSLMSYVGASVMVIITMAQNYLNGALTREDGLLGLALVGWGILFGGSSLSKTSIFNRLFRCLDKFRGPIPEPWSSFEAGLLCARVLVLLLALAVAAGIGAGALQEWLT